MLTVRDDALETDNLGDKCNVVVQISLSRSILLDPVVKIDLMKKKRKKKRMLVKNPKSALRIFENRYRYDSKIYSTVCSK
jgi:hypothetical protein